MGIFTFKVGYKSTFQLQGMDLASLSRLARLGVNLIRKEIALSSIRDRDKTTAAAISKSITAVIRGGKLEFISGFDVRKFQPMWIGPHDYQEMNFKKFRFSRLEGTKLQFAWAPVKNSLIPSVQKSRFVRGGFLKVDRMMGDFTFLKNFIVGQ